MMLTRTNNNGNSSVKMMLLLKWIKRETAQATHDHDGNDLDFFFHAKYCMMFLLYCTVRSNVVVAKLKHEPFDEEEKKASRGLNIPRVVMALQKEKKAVKYGKILARRPYLAQFHT
jgi:hypothetical protein